MQWNVYSPTGVVNNEGSFDSSQLNGRQEVGYLPALTVNPKGFKGDIVRNLADYLQQNKVETAVFHGSGDIYGNEGRVDKSIEFCRDLNDEIGSPIIKKMVFKAASLHTQEEERKKRNSYQLFNGSNPTFNAEEFLDFFGKARKVVNEKVGYADDNDLELLVRTVHTENYATRGYLPEIQESKYDARWLGTGWLPIPVNQGDVGTAVDVDALTDGGIAPSIDRMLMTEHLSRLRNFETMGEPRDLNEHQAEVLEKFGFYIPEKGNGPVVFKEPVDALERTKEWGDRVRLGYFSGSLGTGMHFKDNVGGEEVYKIASLTPILNKDRGYFFIDDEETRKDLITRSMDILGRSKRTFEGIGCNEAVISSHIGKDIHSGSYWNLSNQASLKIFNSL